MRGSASSATTMRVLLVLVLAVSLGAADRCFRECARQKGRVRLDSQEVRINHLTAKIQALEDEIDQKIESGENDHDILVALSARLNELDHEGCPQGQFYCGGNSGECIDNLLVCDGEYDCKNHYDEDPEVCSSPIPAGSKWTGAALWDECTTRQPYSLSVVVSDTERVAFYPNHVNVNGALIVRSKDRHTASTSNLYVSGFYDFAERKLVLHAPESDGLGVVLDFNTGDPGSANAYVVRESTGEKCALFVLHQD